MHEGENKVYDIRNDQALPSLQTATNKEGVHRYRTVRLRPACLAGVAPYARNTPSGFCFQFVPGTTCDKTLGYAQTQE
jgi:hypothetical protein